MPAKQGHGGSFRGFSLVDPEGGLQEPPHQGLWLVYEFPYAWWAHPGNRGFLEALYLREGDWAVPPDSTAEARLQAAQKGSVRGLNGRYVLRPHPLLHSRGLHVQFSEVFMCAVFMCAEVFIAVMT